MVRDFLQWNLLEYGIVMGIGLLCYGVFIMNVWKIITCRQKIVAEYTGCHTVHNFRGVDSYMPLFSYEWEGQHYRDIKTGYGCSKRKITKYQSGNQYSIYINPHHPQFIKETHRIGATDLLLLFFGTVNIGVACTSMLASFSTSDSAAPTETGLNSLQELSEENIWNLSISSIDEETHESKDIEVYLDEQRIVVDDKETALTFKQCEELRGLIVEYTYQVKAQKSDYWPQTEEYPAMLVLFQYEIWYGEERYKQSGALCYPDGWQEFINLLESYREKSHTIEGKMEDQGNCELGEWEALAWA